jgi:GTP cyclohydrolase I
MEMNGTLQGGNNTDLLIEHEARPDRLRVIVADLMTELGMDLEDQHFRGTPARVARLYRELMRGLEIDQRLC